MTVAYYVSAHGYGHAVRAAQVIRVIDPAIPVVVCSAIARSFLEQEIPVRTYDLESAKLDVGAIGSDSVSVDPASTFEAAWALERDADALIEQEVERLEKVHARVVVSDVPAIALAAARNLGIPGILIANFTWIEIYRGLTEMAGNKDGGAVRRSGEELIERLTARYAQGDLLLRPGFSLSMTACSHRADIPIIARKGRSARAELCDALGFDPAKPIFEVYLGTEGYAGVDWAGLDEFEVHQFFSFTPVPGDREGRIAVLDPALVAHADATASVDGVLGKLGYSLCAECVAAGKPMIYPPRPDFVEMPALEREMKRYGLGIGMTAEAFKRLDLGDALDTARKMASRVRPPQCDGAEVAARAIEAVWLTGDVEAGIASIK